LLGFIKGEKILIATSKILGNKVLGMKLSDDRILAIGGISLALGILIGRFLNFDYAGVSITAFVEGILLGLSLVMNLAYLVRRRTKQNTEHSQQ